MAPESAGSPPAARGAEPGSASGSGPAPESLTPVPSPCISLCEMAPDTGLCRGCLRTIDEIVQWGSADDHYKRAVWAEIHRREARLGFD
jgi:predicted Fe-S protein YdhL (DUF1289 family)